MSTFVVFVDECLLNKVHSGWCSFLTSFYAVAKPSDIKILLCDFVVATNKSILRGMATALINDGSDAQHRFSAFDLLIET
jgi:hypothetical protein